MIFGKNNGSKKDKESEKKCSVETKVGQTEEEKETGKVILAEVVQGDEGLGSAETCKSEADPHELEVDEIVSAIPFERTEEDKKKSDQSKETLPPSVDTETIVNQMADAIQQELYENIGKIVSHLAGQINTLQQSMMALVAGQKQVVLNQADTAAYVKSLKEGLVNAMEQQELTIQKQHNAALKFQEDVIYKIQKNLILELIGISDNIRMILQDQAQQPDYDLLGAVKGLNKWVDASLENNSVRRFQDTEINNRDIDRKRQEVIDRELTDDEKLDGTYISEAPGYVWSIPYLVVNSDVQLEKILNENKAPKMFSFVIRPEQVINLKYDKEHKTIEE